MTRRVDRAFRRFQQRGDHEALAFVFDQTADQLYRLAWHLSGDRHAAEDLVQATFVAAIEDARTHAQDRAVLPWLCGILANRARMWWRRRQVESKASIEHPTACDDPCEAAALRELSAAARTRLHALPEPYRTACVLHLEHGMDAQDVARALARPDGTVRSQLMRGLDMLRRALPVALGAGLRAAAPPPNLALLRQRVLAHAGAAGAALHAHVASPLASPVPAMAWLAGAAVTVALGLAWWTLQPITPAINGAESPQDGARDEASPTTALSARGDSGEHAVERRSLPAAPAPDPAAMLLAHVQWEADGTPAAGVAVRFLPTRDDADLCERVAVTDARGVARFPQPLPGHATLRAERGGESEVVVRAGGVTVATCAVPHGVLVQGRVRDGDDRPVAGAAIWLSCDTLDLCRGEVVTHSDGDGSFRIRDVTPGRLLSARVDGKAAAFVQPVPASEAEAFAPTLVLDRDAHGRVFGRVVDECGAPIANAKVLLGVPSARVLRSARVPRVAPAHATHTDSAGAFAFSGIDVGDDPLPIRACALGRALEQREVTVTASTQVTLALAREAAVVGTAIDRAGEPAWRGEVGVDDFELRRVRPRLPRWAQGATAPWRDGRFALRNLPAGDTRLRAVDGDDVALRSFRISAGETVTWDAGLREMAIAGEIVGERGEPLAGWDVWTVSENAPRLDGVTDARGRFTLGGADSARYELFVSEPARQIEMSGVAARVDGVSPGGAALRITVPDAQRASARIRARVLAPSGTSAPNTAVLQRWGEDGSYELARALLVAGRLHTRLLRPGIYRLRFDTTAGTLHAGPFVVHAEQELEVGTLQVQVPGAFVVDIEAEGGAPASAVGWQRAGAEPGDVILLPVQQGRVTVSVAQPGTHWLLTLGRTRAGCRIDVRAGTTTHARLVVPASVRRQIQIPARSSTTTRWQMLNEAGALVAVLSRTQFGPDGPNLEFAIAPGRYTVDTIDLRRGTLFTDEVVVTADPEGAPIVLR